MDAYFDSAIIVKLYVQEATSPDAIRLVAGHAAPYALTQWQALEVKNARYWAVARSTSSTSQPPLSSGPRSSSRSMDGRERWRGKPASRSNRNSLTEEALAQPTKEPAGEARVCSCLAAS